jgi:hypothetical protein
MINTGRYGNVRITKIKAAYDDLRRTVRFGDMEAAEAALDRYEQWADYAFGAAPTLAEALAVPEVAALVEAAQRILDLTCEAIEDDDGNSGCGQCENDCTGCVIYAALAALAPIIAKAENPT